ncbi:MAG TPA: DUF1559 domain-containing protein [Gemmataceae bacterium]|nr:DUF1559 domain-containing protein [Gemmataceae bacterium]
MTRLVSHAEQGKKTDDERILGTWRLTKGQQSGEDLPPELVSAARFAFSKDGRLAIFLAGTEKKEKDGGFKIVGPGQIDIGDPGKLSLGIYKFEGDDKLLICFSDGPMNQPRPDKFEAPKGSSNILFVLERAKPDEKMTDEEKAKLKIAIEKTRLAAARTVSLSNLRQLAVVMHMYHDQYKSLPAHAIYSKDGKTPLLSWRVAILPFIEQNALYQQFKLDEPWDSEHNKKLIGKMPQLYEAVIPEKKKEGMTYYQVFTGPDTVFDGNTKRRFTDITDGSSNTIMIIEAKEPVIWTKPADVVLPADKAKMPELGGLFSDLMNFAMCDGSVHSAHNVQDPAIFRPLVTPNAGDNAEVEKLKVAK